MSDDADRERPCPICGDAMIPERELGITLAVCWDHGVWAGRGELRALRRRLQLKEQAAERGGRRRTRPPYAVRVPEPHPNAGLVPEGQRPCPVCRTPMPTEEAYGVTVDVCPEHGIWLDRGKLGSIERGVERREHRLARVAREDADRREMEAATGYIKDGHPVNVAVGLALLARRLFHE